MDRFLEKVKYVYLILVIKILHHKVEVHHLYQVFLFHIQPQTVMDRLLPKYEFSFVRAILNSINNPIYL